MITQCLDDLKLGSDSFTRKQILAFLAMGIVVLVIAVDIASVDVALSAIEKDFKPLSEQLSAVLSIIVFKGLLLPENSKNI